MPLGTGVCLGPDDIVLDEDPVPLNGGTAAPLFGRCLLWPNGWMDQDAVWYGGRFQPRPHCVRWGPAPSPGKGHSIRPLFGPCLLWPNGRPSRSVLLSFCLRMLSNTTNSPRTRIKWFLHIPSVLALECSWNTVWIFRMLTYNVHNALRMSYECTSIASQITPEVGRCLECCTNAVRILSEWLRRRFERPRIQT